jgi:alpha/beta superfamily hydrolase
MEEKITFLSNGHEIEGLLGKNSKTKGAVISHPHPLYGGNMHNNVVEVITRVYQKKGYTTLRFNFRGIGKSQGAYADGVGEQEDVRAAVSFLKDAGRTTIDLAGYSFGTWVNALAISDDRILESMIMVSPPVAFIDFSAITHLGRLKLIITGSRDDIAPVGMVKDTFPKWNPAARFEVIEGADHFYWGYEDKLEIILAANL